MAGDKERGVEEVVALAKGREIGRLRAERVILTSDYTGAKVVPTPGIRFIIASGPHAQMFEVDRAGAEDFANSVLRLCAEGPPAAPSGELVPVQ